ncbi:helix-turn-helix transcriptional regulator [Flavobacterium sp.]|uniref:helix-turn-helix domain-containing protein n=1 Tax=Flavobacterium sp. TaxID=239 RepID=UPI00286DF9AE|nr:helix-turn-helix transcriptional regulator [Flavobacterium sp.]
MIKEIFKYTMLIGIILGIIFIIYTSFTKKGKDKSIIYLNLFVLFLTLNNLQITLVDNGLVVVDFFVRKLLIPWYALIIPSFYTFVTYYLKLEKRVTSFVSLSIALFSLELMFRIVFYIFFYEDTYVVAKYAQIEEIINVIFTIFLFSKVIVIFLRQSKLYAFVLTFDNMKWLKQFLFLGVIILFLWVMAILFNLENVINPEISIYYPLRFSSSIVLYWIAYQGFFHYNLLSERIKLREVISNEIDASPPKSQKIDQDNDFIFIQNHILKDKKYLDSTYTIENLALETNISSRNVSQILQKNTNYNFTDYINQLRVEKAKKCLRSSNYSHYTIVSIGLECGFHSKSTFYRAFTKFTNKTPTQYKQEKGL